VREATAAFLNGRVDFAFAPKPTTRLEPISATRTISLTW
jgi:hypothetical protein